MKPTPDSLMGEGYSQRHPDLARALRKVIDQSYGASTTHAQALKRIARNVGGIDVIDMSGRTIGRIGGQK